jgi:hypothetical protein
MLDCLLAAVFSAAIAETAETTETTEVNLFRPGRFLLMAL